MKKRRFSKEDWLLHGLKELSAHGPEAVKLEAICKSAGLTRGSFYHHFDDHEAYLTGLADMWRHQQTDAVADRMDPETSVRTQMEALSAAAMAIDYRLELGMRELARRLPSVADIVRTADRQRLTVISDLYQRRYALDKAQADAFAYLEYAAFSGIILLDPDISHERQMTLATLYDRTVSQVLDRES